VFSRRQRSRSLTGGDSNDEKIKDGDGYVEGMFLSLILRPSFFPSQAATLGAMTAVSLITALEEHTEASLGLGWVSDIFCEGEKIGATSIEGKLDSFTAYEYIIVTFAVRLSKDSFPPRLTDMIKQVFESENTSISMIIARNVLSKFFRYYPYLKSSSKYMDEYKNRFLLRGKRIKLTLGDRRESCKVLGIDSATSALIVESKDGETISVTTPNSVTLPKKLRVKRTK
jgi:BirA family biotin operon repressor/biotin-[acetyl-CoA-carboxylase] ligase